jgi:hypothetical protein
MMYDAGCSETQNLPSLPLFFITANTITVLNGQHFYRKTHLQTRMFIFGFLNALSSLK